MWPKTPPKKFVIWGLEMYSHTHSYIHYGYEKAARSLGWDVIWVSDNYENKTKYIECDEFLFFTMESCDTHIPINPNAFYILHNCDDQKYMNISERQKLVLQVYTTDVDSRDTVSVLNKKYEFWQKSANVLYMPWATDLLPDEIQQNIDNTLNTGNYAAFVGSVLGGFHGNIEEISLFEKACKNQNKEFKIYSSTKVSVEESIQSIKNAEIAPTIVGRWQKEKGYIPCRIFKTISYGKLGITNSKHAADIIGNDMVLYNSNEYALGMEAFNIVSSSDYKEKLIKSMNIVKEKHTYINRIETLQYIFQQKLLG